MLKKNILHIKYKSNQLLLLLGLKVFIKTDYLFFLGSTTSDGLIFDFIKFSE